MPKVYNRRRGIPIGVCANTIYVGRPSRWGNRHPVGWCPICRRRHARGEALAAFRADMSTPEGHALQQEARKLPQHGGLRGANLSCWCTPLPCHADFWLEVANAD